SLRLNFPKAVDALSQALLQLGPDASDKYFKYAFQSMSPDGGLPYLLETSRVSAPTHPSHAIIEKIAPEIGKRERIATLTINAITNALLDIGKKPAAGYQATERAVLFMAANLAKKQPELNDSLLKIRAELERSAWDAGDWRHHLLSNLNRLFSDPVTPPP